MHPERLVGIRIAGGLGNQLFSYAVGLALATRLNGTLRFDTRALFVSGAPPFRLGAFGLEIKSWTPTWWKFEKLARQISLGSWRPGPERLVEERDFEPSFFDLQPPCFLKGWFQSWRYFADYEDIVRSAFETSKLSTPRIAEFEREIATSDNAVIVHVRRGDYVNYSRVFELIGRDYYNRAREVIESSTDRPPTYYLFSDEMDKATELLAGWDQVVPVVGFDDLEDFRLMSVGRHFIIPNSTFSWWAAWLARMPDKIVVAPRQWFADTYDWDVDIDARLPPQWIKV